ncbi:MAG: glycosyltransferase [Acidimicrobiales bacterium]|nr:glycosyltransferase [Acidimicrobiales bacterium]
MKVLRIYHSGVVAAWRRRDAELAARGMDVTLVSARRWDEGGEVVELGDADAHVVGARTWGTHPFTFVYDPRPLWRALRSSGAEVIDVHEEPASLAVAEVLVLARLAGHGRTPVCLYCAENTEKRYPWPFRWFERRALRRAVAVHTCNDEAGRILRRKGFSGEVVNLGLGVDVERFAPTAPPRDGAPMVVGYVGRLTERKGVGVLVDAVAAVEGVELVVVGDGPDRAAVEARVARLGLGDRVRVVGYADHDALPGVYGGFDVVVVPSLATPGWVEQFGRVAVEAMAAGVAVVASDVGSLPEVLGDAGVLVAPGDVEVLAGALAELRDDPGLRAALAAAGRERARHYSWAAVAGRQAELYAGMAR